MRECTYREFAQFVTSLRGAYVTAEDAGTTPDDMAVIQRHTRFATCIPERVGGSENPSAMTARGVIRALEAALDFRQLGGLEGKQLAMQGGGNVGSQMIELLFRMGIVSCSNEQAGSLPDDLFVLRHLEGETGWKDSIYNVTQRVLRRAAAGKISSTEAAEELADERAQDPHPIWGSRTREIIESLWNQGWASARTATEIKAPR